jgi:hypothetical protein
MGERLILLPEVRARTGKGTTAHAIRNKAEAAYRRGDLMAKRRELMDAWAAWCGA